MSILQMFYLTAMGKMSEEKNEAFLILIFIGIHLQYTMIAFIVGSLHVYIIHLNSFFAPFAFPPSLFLPTLLPLSINKSSIFIFSSILMEATVCILF